MRPEDRTVEQELARIARTRHGVVTRTELLHAGITVGEIKHRLAIGGLLREHPGVYLVGHRAPSLESRYLAAVRAAGPGALLAGPAAGFLLGILRGAVPEPQVLSPTKREIAGVRIVRSRRIDPEDVTRFRGIPCTTVPRTVVDLAALLDAGALARACHEAGVRYRTTPGQVEAVLARRPSSRGAANLRTVLRGDAAVTLSRLEGRFLERLREAGLPTPETNRRAGGRRVDCRWPERRVTVELDSYRYHSSRHAWEQDRQREREAHARGDELRRYTYGDVFERPALLLAELQALLLP